MRELTSERYTGYGKDQNSGMSFAMSIGSVRSIHEFLPDAKTTHKIFSSPATDKTRPSDDPVIKTSSVALNKHGDAILHLAHTDLQRAEETQRHAAYYESEARYREAEDMRDQARAFKSRGNHRLSQAAEVHQRAKAARTRLERFGPIAWKVFIVLSIISMLAGFIGSFTSSKKLEKIRRDAAAAAKGSQANS